VAGFAVKAASGAGIQRKRAAGNGRLAPDSRQGERQGHSVRDAKIAEHPVPHIGRHRRRPQQCDARGDLAKTEGADDGLRRLAPTPSARASRPGAATSSAPSARLK